MNRGPETTWPGAVCPVRPLITSTVASGGDARKRDGSGNQHETSRPARATATLRREAPRRPRRHPTRVATSAMSRSRWLRFLSQTPAQQPPQAPRCCCGQRRTNRARARESPRCVSATVARANARRAVSNSNSTQPKAQMSLRRPTAGPSPAPGSCRRSSPGAPPRTVVIAVSSAAPTRKRSRCRMEGVDHLGQAEVEHLDRAVRRGA